jgi:hypothetical protein
LKNFPLSGFNKATAANSDSQEHSVANNKNPDQKQPGEKEPGKFHYNPGNMSGKTIGTNKDESEQINADTNTAVISTKKKSDKNVDS